jgi:hypothetical protein
MIHEVGISLYPNRKNWMTEAFEHFSSGFIFLEFTDAFRHRFQHGWFPIPNSIFDRRRGTTPWLCSSGRWLWMLWTNIQKPIGLSEDWIYDIPQRLPSNNGKNEALIQQHLIFWYQTQILNDSNAWSSGVCIKHCVSRTCKTVSRCVTSLCFAKQNSRLEARHLFEF